MMIGYLFKLCFLQVQVGQELPARAWFSRPVVGPARITDMDGVLPSIYDSPVLTTQPSLPSGNVDCINNIQLINFFWFTGFPASDKKVQKSFMENYTDQFYSWYIKFAFINYIIKCQGVTKI